MMKHFLFWSSMITLLLGFLGCASQQTNVIQDSEIPYIAPDRIGNVRIAVLSKGRQNNIVVVNQSNSSYLSIQDFAKEIPQNEIPLSAFKYRAEQLPFDSNTVVVIVEDEVMAKLLGLFEKYTFEEFAEPCSRKNFADEQWPERDGIFLENNDQWLFLLRDEKLTNEVRQATTKGQTYRSLKSYILQAHATGYRPMQVLYNTDGQGLFQNSQNRLQQNPTKLGLPNQ